MGTTGNSQSFGELLQEMKSDLIRRQRELHERKEQTTASVSSVNQASAASQSVSESLIPAGAIVIVDGAHTPLPGGWEEKYNYHLKFTISSTLYLLYMLMCFSIRF